MLSGRRIRGRDAQTPRHAQMHDQMAAIQFKQQVFGAPFDPSDPLAGSQAIQVTRNRLAQSSLAHDYGGYLPAPHVRGDAAQRGFYFR